MGLGGIDKKIKIINLKREVLTVTDKEKIALLEYTIEAEVGTLSESTKLNTLENWDSIGELSLMAMFKKEFGRVLTPAVIRSFETIGDIVREMRSED